MSLRRIFKVAAFGVSLLLTSPLILLAWIEKGISSSEAVFVVFAQLLSLVPGVPGNYLRGSYYFGTLNQCSWETHIGFGSMFMHREASVERNVSTGSYCVIGHARIGSDVRLASRISIPSGKRQHLDEQGRLSAETKYDEVVIGKGCWIGEGAIIMADIGEESIVSAGAVVIKAMPESSLIGGNPARVLKTL
jgi:acetyltransferase-like isoleucine patch superfamily enzyme